MSDCVSPPFSVFLSGHGAAGARRVDAAETPTDEPPDTEAALRVFARAVDVDASDPDYHFILGRALIDSGRLVEAIPALRKAVMLHPEQAEYRLSLGHALWRAGRFAQAAEAFSEATRLQPDQATAWSGVGAARLAADDAAQALSAIEEALRLDGNQADAASNRGVALWKCGDAQAAVEAFDAALSLDPEPVFAYRNLGLALLALEQPEEALAAFDAARQLRPEDAAIRVDIAEACFRLGYEEEAHDTFREALALSPTCLEGRPQAREAFLASAASSLRGERQPRRSRFAAVIAPAVALQVSVSGALHWLLGLRRRLTTAIVFAVLAVGLYPLSHLTQVYVRHYLFVDDLGAVASTPLSSDRDVFERLTRVVQRRGLSSVVDPGSCQIASLSRWRTISCRYQVDVRLLPGVQRKLTFQTSVERFYVALDQLGQAEQTLPGSGR